MKLESAINFRGVGGIRNREGRLLPEGLIYRTGELVRLSADECRIFVRQLGVKTYIDFRTEEEVTRTGRPEILLRHKILWRHLPISQKGDAFFRLRLPSAADHVRLYLDMLEVARKQIATLFQELALGGVEPVILGCTAGKDRTGVCVALLLEALGFDHNVIAEDYQRSEPALTGNIDFFLFHHNPLRLTRDEYRQRFRLSAQVMLDFLRGIATRYGSLSGYLKTCGITLGDLTALRGQFLR